MYKIDNVKKDPYDPRDYIFNVPDGTNELPLNKDLRIYAGSIENQLNTNSCVANACVSTLEILLSKANGFENLSRLFLYYNIREPYSYLNEVDQGAYVRDAFKSVSNKGICSEDTWPFDISEVNSKPSDLSYTEALSNLCTKYERVCGWGQGDLNNAAKMKYALAQGYPLLISMKLGSSFFSISGDIESQDYQGVQDDLVGGHAMCVVGYDDNLNAFIVENSWGTSWGDDGYCAIDYQVMVNDLQDCWVCTEFAGHIFEPEFNIDTTPLVTSDIHIDFYFNDTRRDFNLYFLADAVGGKDPYTYEFFAPGSLVKYQEESEQNLFHMTYVLPEHVNSSTTGLVACKIKDSNIPYQSTYQTVYINCVPGEQPNTKTDKNITELYVAYFNRVPDADGLDYWLNGFDHNDINVISQTFYDIAITDSSFPNTTEDFIFLMYNRVLDRDPDTEGFNYWVSEINNNNISEGQFLINLINIPNGSDKVLFDNKVFVAQEYAQNNQTYDLDLIGVDVTTVENALGLLI